MSAVTDFLAHVDGKAGVDLITGTLGKALGGASGGFTAGPAAVVELLRQRSRPYLFSNSLAPTIVGASIAVLDLLEAPAGATLRDRLHAHTAVFRQAIAAAGFEIKPGDHPIVPIMVHDAVVAQRLAARLLDLGVYVVGFFFPVVPRGQARIRVQLSAAHTPAQLQHAVAAFTQAGHELGLLARAHRRSSSWAPMARSAPSWPKHWPSATALPPWSPATWRRRAACPGCAMKRWT